jgi:hypothetical protein
LLSSHILEHILEHISEHISASSSTHGLQNGFGVAAAAPVFGAAGV